MPVANSTSMRVFQPCFVLLAAGLAGPQLLLAQDNAGQVAVPYARAYPQCNQWELRTQETGDLFIPPAD